MGDAYGWMNVVALLLSKADDYLADSSRFIVKCLRLISQSKKLLCVNSDWIRCISNNSSSSTVRFAYIVFQFIDETICKTQFVSSFFAISKGLDNAELSKKVILRILMGLSDFFIALENCL